MKTLADLKRQAKLYLWEQTHNSWFPCRTIPGKRQVGRVMSQRLTLLTEKNGETHESWLDFPKAKDLEIKETSAGYELTITTPNDVPDRQDHIMRYELTAVTA